MSNLTTVSVNVGGIDLTFETGKIGKQANGCVFARYAGSVVIATVCCGEAPSEPLDYVPVSVEYNEKYYAAGKIPGGFLKRESKPKDKEILVSRLIDRPMRPLFDKAFGREIQIVPTVVSSDMIHTPDIVAINAASCAVTISDIPFYGPIAAVRVAKIGDEFVINPTFQQIPHADLDIVVAGTHDGITMVEGGAHEVSEDDMLGAIAAAQPVITSICEAQTKMRELCGKEKLPLMEIEEEDLSWMEELKEYAYPLEKEASFVKGKMNRGNALSEVHRRVIEKYSALIAEDPKRMGQVIKMFDDMEYNILRASILNDGVRTDGRKVTEIRPITCEVGVLPCTHGSALFTRGETQSLAVTTLGTVSDEQLFDNIDGEKTYSNFMLHYNFPPYSVGECGRLTTGRREIGHGHLAQRALEAVVPKKDNFPYTIRVVSEIMESNGSSSMASVCGGCLSLMDAGVPISKPVAGIAMGLITEGADYSRYVVLSDILGEEDHLGDMDFKVAGTKKGITAIQMDIKIHGLTRPIIEEAIARTRQARIYIMDEVMSKAIAEPRPQVGKYAPKIIQMSIDPSKIGDVVGQRGKTINAIIEKTGVKIDITDDGNVSICGTDAENMEKAKKMIAIIVTDLEAGMVLEGDVVSIKEFGAFVEFAPGKEGMVHISKIAKQRIEHVEDVLTLGDHVKVVCLGKDKMGRLSFSIKDVAE